MAQKDRIAIDITSEKISIIVGTRFKILNAVTIETPKGAYDEDNIVDIEALRRVMEPHVAKGKSKIRDAYFIVRGDDLIVRRITLPNMKEAAMRESVEWELEQFVGERADEYNVSYEVAANKSSAKDGNCEVLMVAVEKTKTNKYLELGKLLGLNVKALDICSNASARILRGYQQIYAGGVKTIGVVDISANSCSLAVVERGKMMLEKYQGYGMLSASNEPIDNNMDYEVFLDKIDFEKENTEDFTDGKLERLFDSLNNQFNTIIQFYSSGKIKKNLDKILLLGSGSKIKGLDKYFEETFNTQVQFVPSFDSFRFSVKVSSKIQLKDYFYAYGLLLRLDDKELNLIPVEFNNVESAEKNKKSAIAVGILILLSLVVGFAGVKVKKVMLDVKKSSLEAEIAKNKEILEKEAMLDNDINLINAHITKVSNLGDIKTKDTKKVITELISKFPSNIKAEQVAYSQNNIEISGTSTNQESIEELWANLRETEVYKKSHISNISENSGAYKFTLSISLGGGDVNGNS